MDNLFDPYNAWLDIPADAAIDHYILLGIRRYESDLVLIATSARDRTTALLNIASRIPPTKLRILTQVIDEVRAAELCLITAESKQAYDAGLREETLDDFDFALHPPVVHAPLIETDIPHASYSRLIDFYPKTPVHQVPQLDTGDDLEESWQTVVFNGSPQDLVIEGEADADGLHRSLPRRLSYRTHTRLALLIMAPLTWIALFILGNARSDYLWFLSPQKSQFLVTLFFEPPFHPFHGRLNSGGGSPIELIVGDPDVTEEEELEEEVDFFNEELEEEESETEEELEIEEVTPTMIQSLFQRPDSLDPSELLSSLGSTNEKSISFPIDINDMMREAGLSDENLSKLIDRWTKPAKPGYVTRPPSAPSALESRTTGGRAGAIRKGGGSPGSESAVEAALRWLANHQNRDGSWSFDYTHDDKCSGFANPGDDISPGNSPMVGATGLALLPFLAAGYTHLPAKNNKHEYVVRKGLVYLVGKMDPGSGKLYDSKYWHYHMYSHGIAACALVEAYGMTQDRKLKLPAQKAINYITASQKPQTGGWHYTPTYKGPGDTSVACWQVTALNSAVVADLDVPGHVKSQANKWLDSVGFDKSEYGGGFSRYGYMEPRARRGEKIFDQDGAMTASGLLCRTFLGTKKEDPGQRKGVEWLAAMGPARDNIYLNYHATMVMFQNDGPKGKLWKKWNNMMRELMIESQVKQGPDAGSWYFAGNHGHTGGRLMSTCMSAMILEVYYRYRSVFQDKSDATKDFPLE